LILKILHILIWQIQRLQADLGIESDMPGVSSETNLNRIRSRNLLFNRNFNTAFGMPEHKFSEHLLHHYYDDDGIDQDLFFVKCLPDRMLTKLSIVHEESNYNPLIGQANPDCAVGEWRISSTIH